MDLEPWNMKVTNAFETSKKHPVTQRHIPDARTPRFFAVNTAKLALLPLLCCIRVYIYSSHRNL